MVDVMALAEFLIVFAKDTGQPINNQQLQNLLFKIQVEHIIKHDKCFFKDKFMIKKGQIYYPDVYYRFCGFGGNSITITKFFQKYQNLNLNKRQLQVFINIITNYGFLSTWELRKDVSLCLNNLFGDKLDKFLDFEEIDVHKAIKSLDKKQKDYFTKMWQPVLMEMNKTRLQRIKDKIKALKKGF